MKCFGRHGEVFTVTWACAQFSVTWSVIQVSHMALGPQENIFVHISNSHVSSPWRHMLHLRWPITLVCGTLRTLLVFFYCHGMGNNSTDWGLASGGCSEAAPWRLEKTGLGSFHQQRYQINPKYILEASDGSWGYWSLLYTDSPVTFVLPMGTNPFVGHQCWFHLGNTLLAEAPVFASLLLV